ncbi:CBS domain-containing protein [Streptomyces sp. NBC_00073]|nr:MULTISPECIES: CBS domain-containing protein [unclassified Streptomyces]
MQSHSADANPAHRTADDALDAAVPQVCDDMTVEVALAVMASARAGHLLVSDEDGSCTGLITEGRLIAIRDSAAYTDRIRLRAVLGDHGPFTLPVVHEPGSAPGVLAHAR